MADRPILSEGDYRTLMQLLTDRWIVATADEYHVKQLHEKLQASRVVPRNSLPETVISLNCKVELLDLSTQATRVFTLVDPADANIAAGKLSVLAPLGVALIGSSSGTTVSVTDKVGQRHYQIRGLPKRSSQQTTTSLSTKIDSDNPR
jgi:regulator of nucleoside diphosphate kinase